MITINYCYFLFLQDRLSRLRDAFISNGNPIGFDWSVRANRFHSRKKKADKTRKLRHTNGAPEIPNIEPSGCAEWIFHFNRYYILKWSVTISCQLSHVSYWYTIYSEDRLLIKLRERLAHDTLTSLVFMYSEHKVMNYVHDMTCSNVSFTTEEKHILLCK